MLGLKNTVIYIVSDSLGDTAEFVAKAAASQFNSGGFEVRRVSYVSDRSVIEDVVEEAGSMKSVIAYTLVLPGLKAILEELAHARNIPDCRYLGSRCSQALQSATRLEPKCRPDCSIAWTSSTFDALKPSSLLSSMTMVRTQRQA